MKVRNSRAFLVTTLTVVFSALVLAVGASAHHPGRHGGAGFHGWHAAHASALDKHWLKGAIEGDRFEIAGGQIALQHASSQKVKDLANKLIADHTDSLKDAIALAQRYRIEVPKDPSPTQQWQLETIAGLNGAAFDKSYAKLEVADHVQDIKEAIEEVQEGSAWRIRKAAWEEIPVLKGHLDQAKDALDAVD